MSLSLRLPRVDTDRQATDFGDHEQAVAGKEVSDPTVIGVFRLAISETAHAPEVARMLDSIGRGTPHSAIRKIMTQALEAGLLNGRPAELAEQFYGLLWGDLMTGLLLGVVEPPSLGKSQSTPKTPRMRSCEFTLQQTPETHE
jgi:hypothetical protein